MSKAYACDIIMDLLPQYVDGLVSNETAEVIEAHLQECKNCKEMYDAMCCDISLTEKKEPKKRKKARRPGKAKVILLGYFFILLLISMLIILDLSFGM